VCLVATVKYLGGTLLAPMLIWPTRRVFLSLVNLKVSDWACTGPRARMTRQIRRQCYYVWMPAPKNHFPFQFAYIAPDWIVGDQFTSQEAVLTDIHEVRADSRAALTDIHEVRADSRTAHTDIHEVRADSHAALTDIHEVRAYSRVLMTSRISVTSSDIVYVPVCTSMY
jgi:hypothetical protein